MQPLIIRPQLTCLYDHKDQTVSGNDSTVSGGLHYGSLFNRRAAVDGTHSRALISWRVRETAPAADYTPRLLTYILLSNSDTLTDIIES